MFLFMMVSLDGYIEGSGHDLSWHHVDAEFGEFAEKQLLETDTLVMGRKTYQLMEGFWPSAEGLKGDPETARLMNATPKIVISKTLSGVKETENWQHVRLIKDNIKSEIEELKSQNGKDIAVLGSNNLCVTLLKDKLLDELRIMINPVAIGEGTPLFAGLKDKIDFTLLKSRTFASGNILLYYKPE